MTTATNRRALLTAVASLPLAGCSDSQSDERQSEEPHSDVREIREVVVTNTRDAPVTLAVQIEVEGQEEPFSRVNSLAVDEYDSSAELDGVPLTVRAFTREGEGREWNYGEPTSMNCEALDVEIVVDAEEFRLNKPC